MSIVESAPNGFGTVAELLKSFAAYPPERIRLRPAPGTATEQDVIDTERTEGRLCELIDGVLVEKSMGFHESMIASYLARKMGNFAEEHGLGEIAGADATVRLAQGQVRIPDIAFVSWGRLPRPGTARDPIPEIAPDLAVEVLSPSNTRGEMERKLKDYFFAGVRLVWYVDPEKRVVDVFTAPDRRSRLDESGTLDGGDVLPGFSLPVGQLFARGTPPAAS